MSNGYNTRVCSKEIVSICRRKKPGFMAKFRTISTFDKKRLYQHEFLQLI